MQKKENKVPNKSSQYATHIEKLKTRTTYSRTYELTTLKNNLYDILFLMSLF